MTAVSVKHTLLDHSSIDTLLDGLREHRGVFRFLYEDGDTTEPWNLVQAFTFRVSTVSAPADAVRLLVNFPHTGVQDGYRLWLDDGGWLVTVRKGAVTQRPFTGWTSQPNRCRRKKTGLSKMRAVREPATNVDNSLRRKLDSNLRSIFV